MLNSSAINCICIFDVSSSPNAGENGTPSSPKNWGMARCLALTMQRWEPRSLSWYLYQWSWVTWMTWMLFLYVHKVCVYIYIWLLINDPKLSPNIIEITWKSHRFDLFTSPHTPDAGLQEFHCRDQVFHLRQLVDARQQMGGTTFPCWGLWKI